jgi:hypothetical protein
MVVQSRLPQHHQSGMIAAADKMIVAKFDDLLSKGMSIDEIEQSITEYVTKMVKESDRALESLNRRF